MILHIPFNFSTPGFGKVGHPSKHTPHSLQLWFTRLALLIKLEKYDICATEAEPFDNLDRHDVFYEFYPELSNGKRGSMASFSFRLLLAELPMYLNESKRALDKLTDLYAICLEVRLLLTVNTLVDTYKI